MGCGPATVRGRHEHGRGLFREVRGTDRASVRPKASQPEILRYLDGEDGAVHEYNHLAENKADGRPKEIQVLVAEIVRYSGGETPF